MTTQYTSILKLALPVQGELSGTWGDVVNDNITSMVEQAIAGRAVVNTWSGNSHTLTTANGTTAESRCAMLEFTDTGSNLSAAGTVVCPALSKIYIAKNASGENVTLKTSSGSGILVPNGRTMFLFCDGTNVVEAVTSTTSLQLGTSTTVTAVLDEDNMASNSATSLATQQSIKAYVDAQVGSFDTLAEVLANGNTTTTDQKIQFRDSAIYINSSADGQLDLVADTEIQIAATTVDLNGNLDVSGTVVAGGVVTANAGVVVDNFTLDGTTLALSSGDLTLDSAGGVILDAATGVISLHEAGNGVFGTLTRASGSLAIKSEVSDADILFKGNDSGSAITALTLDMSDAGTAIFNHDATFADNGKAIFGAGPEIEMYSDGTNGYIDTAQLIIANAAHTNNIAKFIQGGAVELFHNNAQKLATTSTGIQITGNIANASGHLTLDVVGQLIVDTEDEGTLLLKNSGTQYGNFFNQGNDFLFKSLISDGDIVFKGVDSGSQITALTLDMSDGGRANFNNDIGLLDGKSVRFGTDNDSAIFHSGSAMTVANSTGNLTLDVAGNIELDADGGQVIFMDGGTNIGRLENSSSDFVIKSMVNDKDIIFKGEDGGSAITALSLDMSDGGTASFNSHIRLGDNKTASFGAGFDIEITSDGTNGTIAAPNGDLTLDVAGELKLDADGGNITLQDGGTAIGQFQLNDSNHLKLVSKVSDADIFLQGVDGGSTITALRLDMSAAGAATFNSSVTIPTIAYVGTSIVHQGDTNTSIDFATDTITHYTGGLRALDLGATFTVFNTNGADVDFRVESNNNANMLFVDGGADRVHIGTTSGIAGNLVVASNSSANGIQILARTADDYGFLNWYNAAGSSQYGAIAGTSSGLFFYGPDGTETFRTGNSGTVFNEDSSDQDFRVESNNNANMLFVDGGEDHVNIGTTSDFGDTFNVSGTGHFTNNVTLSRQTNDAGSTGLIFEKTRNTSVNGNTVVQNGDQLGYVKFTGNDGDQFIDGAYVISYVDGTPGNNDMPASLQFWTTADGASSPTARMVINNKGSVGIGVADGDVTSDGTAARTYVGIIGSGNRGRLNLGSTASNGADVGTLAFTNGANTIADISVDSSSGSQTVGSVFHSSTGAIDIRAAGGVIFNENSADADFRVESDINTHAIFVEGSSSNVHINATTVPDASNSGFLFTTDQLYTSAGNTTNTNTQVRFYNGNGLVGNISTSGSGTAYATSSDQRLKENIADADDSGELIDAIQVRKFDWKADGEHQRYGMVAQELDPVAPEAVSKTDDPEEMMAVDYSKLVPMLIKEIQSLRNRVAQLES